ACAAPLLEVWEDLIDRYAERREGHAHVLDGRDGLDGRRHGHVRMQWHLCRALGQLFFHRRGKQVVDQLLRWLGMWSALHKSNGIRHDESPEVVLIRVNNGHGLLLLEGLTCIIGIRERPGELARCDEVFGLAVTGDDLDAVRLDAIEELLCLSLTPERK